MEKNDFLGFLIRAKKATYASSGDGGGETLPDGTKILTYQEGDLKYIDRYRGMNPFYGAEMVCRVKCRDADYGTPTWEDLWTMNYAGKVMDYDPKDYPDFTKEVYRVLREALDMVRGDCPFRGPASFFSRDAKYFYINHWTGDISFFRGEEYIYNTLTGIFGEVYRLDYHGLLIRPL